MTTETGAPAAEQPLAPPPAIGNDDELTLEDARALLDAMPEGAEFNSRDGESAEEEPPATPEPKSPSKEDEPESPEEETAGKKQDDAEIEPEAPAIDMPKSWAKDATERWNKLDRETQQFLAEADKRDQAAIKRSFNEVAEQRNAIKAELEAAARAKSEYEAKLPALMQALHDTNQAQFADIKSIDDVVKLQAEDPFRFQQWQVHQMRMQAVKSELDQADQRKASEHQSQWAEHVQTENKLAQDLIPELADKDKGPALMKRAAERLADLGFTQAELADLSNGKSKISIFDHRLQQLIYSDLRLQEIQSAPKAVVKPNLPPVQKPGVPRSGSNMDAEIRALEKRLDETGSESDAWALYQAREKARSRRAS